MQQEPESFLDSLEGQPRLPAVLQLKYVKRLANEKRLQLEHIKSLWRSTQSSAFWQQLTVHMDAQMVSFLIDGIAVLDRALVTQEHLRLRMLSSASDRDKCIDLLWALIRDESKRVAKRVSDYAMDALCSLTSSVGRCFGAASMSVIRRCVDSLETRLLQRMLCAQKKANNSLQFSHLIA